MLAVKIITPEIIKDATGLTARDIERALELFDLEIEKNRFQDDRRIRGLKDTYNKFRELKKSVV